MNDKKFLVISLLSLLFVGMMVSVIAADGDKGDVSSAVTAGEELGKSAKSVGEGVAAFFKAAFGDVAVGDEEWLSTVFFAIILGMFIFVSLDFFFGLENKLLTWGVTIGATGLAIIAMPTEYLTALRTSYGAMGLTILAVVPFIIILAFTLKVKSRAIARGTWLVFAGYYFWMYIATIINPGTVVVNGVTKAVSRSPYIITTIVGIFMFIFIGKLRVFATKEEIDSDVEEASANTKRRAAGLQAESERLGATTGIRQS